MRQGRIGLAEAASPKLKSSQPQGEEYANLLSPQEKQILERFFHERLVAKHDMKQSLLALEALFEGFKLPALLQRRIIESFIYSSETVSVHPQLTALRRTTLS